jgi:hypothetical protein
MTNFFRCAAFAPLLALVAGCCANNTCDCDDLQADSLYLVLANNRVNSDTLTTSFTRAELDTVYLQRYAPARPAQPANGTIPAVPAQPQGALSDPVAIVRTQQGVINSALKRKLDRAKLTPATTLVISNTAPFSPGTTGGKLNAYNYVLTVQDRSTLTRPKYVFTLDNITFQGQYNATGCCTCYENTGKEFRLTGKNTRLVNVTETGSVGEKTPVPVSIRKLD